MPLKKNPTQIFLVIIFLILPLQAFALNEEERFILQNNQNQLLIENQIEDTIRQRNLQEIEKLRKSRLKKPKAEEEVEELKGGGCLIPKKLTVTKNTLYSTKFLEEKFLKKYSGQCLNLDKIGKIQDEITNFYVEQGYSTSRAFLDKPKLAKEKIMSFIIIEGRVEDIEIQNNSKIDNNKYFAFRKKTKIFTAFPFLKDKIFDLRDFEQGIDQMNRLQSNDAKIDTIAGDNKGYSDVIIKNNIFHPTRIAMNYDNSGQKATGIYKKNISLSQDNFLGINDNLFFSYTKDDVSKNSQRYSNSFYSNLSVPLGYWTFQLGHSESRYLTTIDSGQGSQPVASSGSTTINSYKFDRIISRGQKHKTKFGGELDVKTTIGYNNNVKREAASRKLTVLSLFIDQIFYFDKSTFYIKPSYQRGMGWFNSTKDSNPTSSSINPKAKYRLLKLYSYYSTNFQIPKTKIPLNHTISFDSQYSSDPLFASEQFNIGNRYTVRGFVENSISGDDGYLFRNDLRINTSHLFPNSWKDSKLFNYGSSHGLSLAKAITKTSFSIFYDYGKIRDKYIIDATKEGYLSGTGAKLAYQGENFNWDLTYSKALHTPNFIEDIYLQNKDQESIYFNFGINFGLF